MFFKDNGFFLTPQYHNQVNVVLCTFYRFTTPMRPKTIVSNGLLYYLF
jgi:hypothetical protein